VTSLDSDSDNSGSPRIPLETIPAEDRVMTENQNDAIVSKVIVEALKKPGTQFAWTNLYDPRRWCDLTPLERFTAGMRDTQPEPQAPSPPVHVVADDAMDVE